MRQKPRSGAPRRRTQATQQAPSASSARVGRVTFRQILERCGSHLNQGRRQEIRTPDLGTVYHYLVDKAYVLECLNSSPAQGGPSATHR
jgi:hypothetical protein